jgi:hypothetical protein
MTYKELLERLKDLDDYQLGMDITVQNGSIDECFPARFLITDHDSLDDEHPVFFFLE